MCGIVGVVSNSPNAFDTLMFGLRRLQNRGYDSAGVCTIGSEFILNKYASGTESALELLDRTSERHANSTIGIAHTRWATHGEKSDINSHPHVSHDAKWALVHNGIIENFKELKTMLLENNYTFQSQTDSEVIANLLAKNYKECGDPMESIQITTAALEGTWGLAIVCADKPNELYCTRNGSPLLIGHFAEYAMVVSEQSGFTSCIADYIVLKNRDICKITRTRTPCGITIETNHVYLLTQTSYGAHDDRPNPYKHWTLNEIHQQPESISRAIGNGGRIETHATVKLGGLEMHAEELLGIDNLFLLGCGTSLNACMLSINYFKDLCSFNCVQICDGADFSMRDVPKFGRTGLILVSQSGETKDLYRCTAIAKQNNLFTIGVINVVDSLIAREVDCGCYINAGSEYAVASTKSFTSQSVVLSMIAIWFAQKKQLNRDKRLQYIRDLRMLQSQTTETLLDLDAKVEIILPLFTQNTSCFVLGKGQSEAIAHEGAQKIKEISYIHCEGYATSSLKHGPFALLCPGFPVILIAPDNEYYSKNENAYNEIKSRNANILWITDKTVTSQYENVIRVPRNETYCDILCTIPLQLLAYKLAIYKGINPDMPKNLAKVVTVD